MGLIDNIKSFSKKEKLGSEKNELLQSFLEKGFPTIKEEDWKYTSLKRLLLMIFPWKEMGQQSRKMILKSTL